MTRPPDDTKASPGKQLGCAGGVSVEEQGRPIDVTTEETALLFGERRTQRRDGRAHTRLMERDHVHIPLREHHMAFLADGPQRDIDPEQAFPLPVDRGLGRVDVLRPVAFDDPSPEREHVAPVRPDREHDPAREEGSTRIRTREEAAGLEKVV